VLVHSRLLLLLLLTRPTLAISWLPAELPPAPEEGPILCQRHYLTPEQGEAVLQEALRSFSDAEAWLQYRQHVRRRIQQGAALEPWPDRSPLNAITHSRRIREGYTVENVAFESLPGVWVTGNLYQPLGPPARRAAVLNFHGHTAPVTAEGDWSRHGRFTASAQTRCAVLARLGAVVLSIDMFGYGDSITQAGADAHRTPLAMTMQIWNAIRAVDYLSSREDVDSTRIATTGESGGGTQAFLLAALDERVAATVPVVMVSSYFFGGCPCESGRPIHRSEDHFVSNAMVAAFATPRPQLIISNGQDWTQHVPAIEFPFLQAVYRLFGAEGAVANVHLPDEGHDYGPNKRAALYEFLQQHLQIAAPPKTTQGEVDESSVIIEPADDLRVFTAAHPLPPGAVRGPRAIRAVLEQAQAR
jgi:hypothetical protein